MLFKWRTRFGSRWQVWLSFEMWEMSCTRRLSLRSKQGRCLPNWHQMCPTSFVGWYKSRNRLAGYLGCVMIMSCDYIHNMYYIHILRELEKSQISHGHMTVTFTRSNPLILWKECKKNVQRYRVFKQQPVNFAASDLWTLCMKMLKSFFPQFLRLVHLWLPSQF